MWVSDRKNDKVYAYKMSDKSRDSTKDINVAILPHRPHPQGIWSDGTIMWVADSVGENSKIYAFTLPATGTPAKRVAAKDFHALRAAENHKPSGLWSDGETLWVADGADDKIYAYPLSDAARLGKLELMGHVPSLQNGDFEVQFDPSFNSGEFNSGTTTGYTASVPYATESLTVSPKTLRPVDRPTGGVFSISPADADATKDGHQVNLTVGKNPISITVADADDNTNTRIYTVVVTREFFTYNDPSKDVLVSTNFIIQGIWANETTLWAADSETTYTNIVTVGETNQANLYKKILAYNRATKQRDAGKDINLIPDNFAPLGIWSNGTIMWVADLNPNPNDNKRKLIWLRLDKQSAP